MEDNLKKFALFTCVIFERNYFPTLPMGVMYLKSVSSCLWTTHTTYPKWVTSLFSAFSLSVVLIVGLRESRHQWRFLLLFIISSDRSSLWASSSVTSFASSSTLSDSFEKIRVFAGDLTRHWLWVLDVKETRGLFRTGKAYFSGDMIMSLFLRA